MDINSWCLLHKKKTCNSASIEILKADTLISSCYTYMYMDVLRERENNDETMR